MSSEGLDDEIARVRAEIANLSKRRHVLSASILSSTKFQTQLKSTQQRSPDTNEVLPSEANPLFDSQRQHNETNIHRLAFGITSFPFTDPNPETSDQSLLGIRFDIPSHTGEFNDAPYYLFCKRLPTRAGKRSIVSVHHHTIPAFVPFQEYVDKYLPQPTSSTSNSPSRDNGGEMDVDVDLGDGSRASSRLRSSPPPPSDEAIEAFSDSSTTPTQDLHALASAIYADLKAWSIRRSSLEILKHSLGLSLGLSVAQDDKPNYSIRSIEPLSVDHNFIRLIWKHGMVGRIKVSSDGFVDLALVYGQGKSAKSEKLDHIGRKLSRNKDGGRVRVADLAERFAEVERTRIEEATMTDNDTTNNGIIPDTTMGDVS